jgi:hypothetical protein
MTIAVGLAIAGVLLTQGMASAATTDFAYGAGISTAGTPFAFSARSAGDGSSPAGRAILGGIFGNSEGAVTCLRVQGSVAAIGFRVERSSVASQVGRSYVAYLQDNGAFAGVEPVDWVGTKFVGDTPTTCPAADPARATSGLYGEAVVKNDSSLPPPPANPTWSLDNGTLASGSFTSLRIAAMRSPDGGAIGYAQITASGNYGSFEGKVVCLDVQGSDGRIGIDLGRGAAEVLAVDGSDSVGVRRLEDAVNSGAADCRPPDQRPYPLSSGSVINRVGDPLPPPPVRCGETVSKDATLTGDLSCDGTALTIGAPGITVDLGGYSVTGDITSIRNPGFDNVTIKHGSVSVNNNGIILDGVSGNVLSDLDLAGLQDGIVMGGSDHNWIVGNRLASVWLALGSGSDANVIRGNRFLGYESFVSIFDSSRNLVSKNLISNAMETGVRLNLADHTVVTENDITAQLGAGVGLLQADDNEISDNNIHGLPNGNNPTEVTGVTVDESHRNKVLRNTFLSTTTAIDVESGWANVLRDNQGVRGSADGFVIGAAAVGTALVHNGAYGFRGDGFDVSSPSTRIGDNAATYNAELGIRAVGGVTDLGGNRAYSNGNAFQCLNVICAR